LHARTLRTTPAAARGPGSSHERCAAPCLSGRSPAATLRAPRMHPALAVTLAVGPCLLWLVLIVRHDDHEREPWYLIALAAVLGGASTLGVLWLRPLLEDALAPLTPALDAFVVTAAAEEGWKLLALLPLALLPELDEPLDGVVYGAAVGLGFAAVENLFYAHQHGDASLLLQRASTATLLHAAASGCLGLCVAEGKLRRFGLPTAAWLAFGVVVAVGGHGLYDLLLCDDRRAQALVALLLVLPATVALLATKVHWARSRSREFHP
jgi:RsiW-degrading membrane proteinase PrsW (M82 family)